MQKINFFIKGERLLILVLAVVIAVSWGTTVVQAATTISTNVSTGGTLSVTGLSTFLGGATTTTLTLLNGEVISNATDGVIQLGGIASSTSITLLNGETITNATDGTVAITAATVSTSADLSVGDDATVADDLTVTGTASTTDLKVGSDMVSTVSGMIFGYCTIATVTVNATSTAYRDCTGATGVTSSYRVFVQATSSLPAGLHIEAASSTATTGTINVRIVNATVGANQATGINSFNFWAVR